MNSHYGPVLLLREAADYVRVSEKTMREMARVGRVPCQRVGREWRFLRDALDGWLAGRISAGGGGSAAVAEHAGQLYLPKFETLRKPASEGFGDTAFTKNREEPVHSWVPWIAGFSASFVGEILDRELKGEASPTVLDPFAGVGTTLIEGFRRGCSVVGFEINPFAALACEVKLEAIRQNAEAVRNVASRLDAYVRECLRLHPHETRSQPPSGFRSRDPFFSPRVEKQILHVMDFIEAEKDGWLQRLLRVALGSVMVGVSNYTYEPSLGRRVAAGKQVVADADVPAVLRNKLLSMARDIEVFRASCACPDRQPIVQVFSESYMTGATGRLAPCSVDIVITSPPYLNNYHYVRNTRPQMYWLGIVGQPGDLRTLETASFGKFWQTVRGEPEVELTFRDEVLKDKLAELRSQHPEKGVYGGSGWANYAATYFNDCARFCEVTAKIIKTGGLVVVVIGNNILQGIEFKTDEIFAQIAERAGFVVRGLHKVRKKRIGSSIINSSIRMGAGKARTELYETAVELRMGNRLSA